MKFLFSFLIAVLAFFGNASAQFTPQEDTTQVTITVKARHHAYLIAFMGDRGDAEKVRYMTQVAKALNVTVVDSIMWEQDIPVTVSETLVKNLYISIGSQQERLTTVYNEEIRQLLLSQIGDSTKPTYRPKLLADIQAIAARNFAETEQMVGYGFQYLKRIK